MRGNRVSLKGRCDGRGMRNEKGRGMNLKGGRVRNVSNGRGVKIGKRANRPGILKFMGKIFTN